MSNSLVVNSSNVIGSNNNTYQYKFIQVLSRVRTARWPFDLPQFHIHFII